MLSYIRKIFLFKLFLQLSINANTFKHYLMSILINKNVITQSEIYRFYPCSKTKDLNKATNLKYILQNCFKMLVIRFILIIIHFQL